MKDTSLMTLAVIVLILMSVWAFVVEIRISQQEARIDRIERELRLPSFNK